MTLAETAHLAVSAQRGLFVAARSERAQRLSGTLTPDVAQGHAAFRSAVRHHLAGCARRFAAAPVANDAAFNLGTGTEPA